MIAVRNASPADMDEICGFKSKSVELNFPNRTFNEELFRRHLLRQVRLKPDMVRVIEVDGKTAGYIWFRLMDSSVGVFGRIEHVFVDEGHRNRGLGKRLMQAAEEYLKGRGAKRIKLTVTKDNKTAASLYKSMGYETKRYVMEKDL